MHHLEILNALPKDEEAVDSWVKKDEAWRNVAQEIRRVVEELKAQPEKGQQQGDNTVVTRIWNILFSRNEFFTEREDVLTKIQRKCSLQRLDVY